jgi:hypothetical protein
MMDGRVAAIRTALDATVSSTTDFCLRQNCVGVLRTLPRSRRSTPRLATAAATRWTPPTAAKPAGMELDLEEAPTY